MKSDDDEDFDESKSRLPTLPRSNMDLQSLLETDVAGDERPVDKKEEVAVSSGDGVGGAQQPTGSRRFLPFHCHDKIAVNCETEGGTEWNSLDMENVMDAQQPIGPRRFFKSDLKPHGRDKVAVNYEAESSAEWNQPDVECVIDAQNTTDPRRSFKSGDKVAVNYETECGTEWNGPDVEADTAIGLLLNNCALASGASKQNSDISVDDQENEDGMSEVSRDEICQGWVDELAGIATQPWPRWTSPPLPNSRFQNLIEVSIDLLKQGRGDGTVDGFIIRVLLPAFSRFFREENVADWDRRCLISILDCSGLVLKMLCVQLERGAGSRDIRPELFSVVGFILDPSSRFHDIMSRSSYIPDEHSVFIDYNRINDFAENGNYEKPYLALLVFSFAMRDGFISLHQFFLNNITKSTKPEDILLYLRTFHGVVTVLKKELLNRVFNQLVLDAVESLLISSESNEEENMLKPDLKNHRGDMRDCLPYQLYDVLCYFLLAFGCQNEVLALHKWRFCFIIRVLNESPFNARMSAVDNIFCLIQDFQNDRVGKGKLAEWMEEYRLIDVLTRDNLHLPSYVDRFERVVKLLLQEGLLQPMEVSTIWEAQRGKHSVIQRHIFELLVRSVQLFDNDLVSSLLHKIEAAWVDGGTRERSLLIDMLRRMSSQLSSINALGSIQLILAGLWKLARSDGVDFENVDAAFAAHLKILEGCPPGDGSQADEYIEECVVDIVSNSGLVVLATQQLPFLLSLFRSDEDSGYSRTDKIMELERNHNIIDEVCKNIVASHEPTPFRPSQCRPEELSIFLKCLFFLLLESPAELTISYNQVCELWECLVKNTMDNEDRSEAFDFFSDLVHKSMLREDLVVPFFRDQVMSYPASNLSEEGWQCFEVFYKAVNEGLARSRKDYSVNSSALVGDEYVWEAIRNAGAVVAKKATTHWVGVMRELFSLASAEDDSSSGRFSLVTRVVTQSLSRIESSVKEMKTEDETVQATAARHASRSIQALLALVEETDRTAALLERRRPPLYCSFIGHSLAVQVCLPETELDHAFSYNRRDKETGDVTRVFRVHSNTTLASLRRRISDWLETEVFKTEGEWQHLLTNTSRVPAQSYRYEDYKFSLADLGFSRQTILSIRLERSSLNTHSSLSSPSREWPVGMNQQDLENNERSLPSSVLACHSALVDLLLRVADADPLISDVASSAFHLLRIIPPCNVKQQSLERVVERGELAACLRGSSSSATLYNLYLLQTLLMPSTPCPVSAVHLRVIREAPVLLLSLLTPNRMLIPGNAAFRTEGVLVVLSLLKTCLATNLSASLASFLAGESDLIELVARMGHAERGATSSAISPDLARASFTHLCSLILAAAAPGSSASFLSVPDESLLHEESLCTPVVAEEIIVIALQSAELLTVSVSAPFPVGIPPSEVLAPSWRDALCASLFHSNQYIREKVCEVATRLLKTISSSGGNEKDEGAETERKAGGCELAEALLRVIEKDECRHKELVAEELCTFFCGLLKLSHLNGIQVRNLKEKVQAGIAFLHEAQEVSGREQIAYPDDSLLLCRLSVLSELVEMLPPSEQSYIGSAPDGPRLIDSLLTHFVLPFSSLNKTETAASSSETEEIPRSMTVAEMSGSQSWQELRLQGSELPRSASALPHLSATRSVAVAGSQRSQRAVFHLIEVLCGVGTEWQNLELALTLLDQTFYSSPWSTRTEWEYSPELALRSATGFVGLKNGGATCYMNSVFQQLFMIPEVREAVLNAPIPEDLIQPNTQPSLKKRYIIKEEQEEEKSEESSEEKGNYAVKVLAAVQILFAHLVAYEMESFTPNDFWNVFNFKNGEAVNVREQQDALEFQNMITDVIDEGLKKLGRPPICEITLGGMFADEKICKDCEHRYMREEGFTSLSLDVRSHNNLIDSLKEYVKGDILENDNAYHCELCDEKVKAVKRLSISRLPPVLIVQLKRFDFDWEKEVAVKFNDYFEFPFEMNVRPFTKDGLAEAERAECASSSSSTTTPPPSVSSNEDCHYLLRGVLVHSGQAAGGHYYSYIRCRDTGKWYKFDDNEVSTFEATEAEARNRWFGADDDGRVGRIKRKTRSWWNAYILFYERVSQQTKPSSSSPPSITALPFSPSGNSSFPSKGCFSPMTHLHRHFSSLTLGVQRRVMPSRLEEMLRQRNRRILIERVQYSEPFFSLVRQLVMRACQAGVGKERKELLCSATRLLSHFLIHTALHANPTISTIKKEVWCAQLHCLMSSVRESRLWLVNHLVLRPDVAACFLFSPSKEVRSFFASFMVKLVVASLEDNVSLLFEPAVQSEWSATHAVNMQPDESVASYVVFLLSCLPRKHNHNFRTYTAEYTRLIYELTTRPETLSLLVKRGVLSFMVQLFSTQRDLSMSSYIRDGSADELYQGFALMLRCCQTTPPQLHRENPFAVSSKEGESFDTKEFSAFFQDPHQTTKLIRLMISEFIRRPLGQSHFAWAMELVAFLCFGSKDNSFMAIETLLSSYELAAQTMVSALLLLLRLILSLKDGLASKRLDCILHDTRIGSDRGAAIRGMVELPKLSPFRREPVLRVLVVVLESLPNAKEEAESRPDMKDLLNQMNVIMICNRLPDPPLPPAQTSTVYQVPTSKDVYARFLRFYSSLSTAMDSTAEQAEEASSDHALALISSLPASSVHSSTSALKEVDTVPGVTGFSAGTDSLSSSSRTSFVAEKRPHRHSCSDEESERKRQSPGLGASPEYAHSSAPVDDDFIAMSLPATSHASTSTLPPPPSYEETVAPQMQLDVIRFSVPVEEGLPSGMDEIKGEEWTKTPPS